MTIGKTSKSWLGRTGAALALTAVATLFNPAGAQTLSVVMASKLTVLDPVLTASHQTRNHGYMIYDTLLATDLDNKIQPQMADKWTISPDGKTYTFTLREGLKFHDGAPVKSEDCIASIQRWAQQDKIGRQVMPLVTEMTPVDDKTFKVVLSKPVDLLTALARPSGLPSFIMPKRVAMTPATQAITDYTGSGPFKFVKAEFQPGVKVVYEKNKDYVPRKEAPSGVAGGKVVNVDRVEWVAMADSMTMVNALTSGEVDYVETVPFDLVPMVKASKGVTVRTLDKLGYQPMYRFNQLQPPFDNKLIRQAAMYAIGQDETLKAQVGDPAYFKTCAAVFGCNLPYSSNKHADMIVPSNIAKAKELLKQAKYDGAPVAILHATDIAMASALPVVMAQELRQAGFNVQLQAMDFMTMLSRRANRDVPAKGGWSIFVTTWHTSEISDPLRNYGISANGEKAWFGWPTVPAIESLRENFLFARTDKERKDIAEQLQDVMLDEGVAVTLGQIVTAAAYSNKLSGVLESPAPVFWNIKKSDAK
ncbi:ABC transporter substrate-binding protein [Xylophilus rhododendri]|uniref:ABC transporter substrate-binding protein n=1 Tax=Xylophilus rhododendri TaxID=2697032 RepID=A0A857J200_9BURK|nr:ABC transporter substrate-binding protein [Xylophilus rhododendri]QHI97746.1 ABC transporter substrate-binding protein [Xylophilus rhododendri]